MDFGANTPERCERLGTYWQKRSLILEECHILSTPDAGALLPGDIVTAPAGHDYAATREWEVIESTDNPGGKGTNTQGAREFFLQQHDDTIFPDVSGTQQGAGSTNLPLPTPAPTDPPNPPSAFLVTGPRGWFQFTVTPVTVTPGVGAVVAVLHQIELASDTGFTTDITDIGIGTVTSLSFGMPDATRYARVRNRYASSGWSSWTNYMVGGVPTAVSSGDPFDPVAEGNDWSASGSLNPDVPVYEGPGLSRKIVTNRDGGVSDVHSCDSGAKLIDLPGHDRLYCSGRRHRCVSG